MKALLADPGDRFGRDGGALDIALGLTADRKGDHEEAFRFISAGKKLRGGRATASMLKANGEASKRLSGRLHAQFSASMGDEGSADNSPIFIIGMPRSGTTLLERILSGHSQIEAAGELPVLPRLDEHLRKESGIPYDELIGSMSADDLRLLGDKYVDRSRDFRTTGKKHFIDKLNHNWMRLGLIRLILPNARIIDLRRDALDCCWSNFKMMFAKGPSAPTTSAMSPASISDYVANGRRHRCAPRPAEFFRFATRIWLTTPRASPERSWIFSGSNLSRPASTSISPRGPSPRRAANRCAGRSIARASARRPYRPSSAPDRQLGDLADTRPPRSRSRAGADRCLRP